MDRFALMLVMLFVGSLTALGDEPAAPAVPVAPAASPTAPTTTPTSPPATPAADGTVSIVVPPPAAPPAAPEERAPPVEPARTAQPTPPRPPVAAPPPPPGPATSLIAATFEPLKSPPAAGGNPAIDPLLYARPLPLREAFERSGDRSRRLWIAQAYWKASVAFASLAWAIDARDRLETTGPGSDPYDRAALDVAVASAAAGVAEAKSELAAAQQELADLARLPIGEPLPWPVDRPLGTAYATHFDVIFAQRLATGRVRAINRMLPSKHEALEARARAVTAAGAAIATAEEDHARGKRPVEAVIAAHAALAAQRRQFLELVRGYNTDIAEYVMAVADFSVPDDRFAAMLIGTPTP